jgi:hypothetical protein
MGLAMAIARGSDATSALFRKPIFWPWSLNLNPAVDQTLDVFGKTLPDQRFSPFSGLTFWVSPLRTQLHDCGVRWLRCSSLQGVILRPPRALPAHPAAAHLGAFNCRI